MFEISKVYDIGLERYWDQKIKDCGKIRPDGVNLSKIDLESP